MDFIHCDSKNRQHEKQKMSILISIIIPIYKVQLNYLRICLDSLTRQALKECEFIMVSDGAPEAECAICEEYAKKDPRFKFYQYNHAGVSATRNRGILEATGNYIIFVDSDDWIAEDALDFIANYIKETNTDIIFWNYTFIFAKGKKSFQYSQGSIPSLDKKSKKELLKELFFCTQDRFVSLASPVNKAFRATIFKDLSFNEDLVLGEDRIFNLQVIKKDYSISYLDKNLYFCRVNASSASHRYRPNAFKTLLQYINQMKILAEGQFNNEIGKETIIKFIESFYTDFFHKENPHSFSQNIHAIMDIMISKSFQQNIESCDYTNLSLVRKLDLFFFKRKNRLWIYFRAIAASAQTSIIYPLCGRH